MPSNYHIVVQYFYCHGCFCDNLASRVDYSQEIRDVFFSKRYVANLDVNVVWKDEMYQLMVKNKKQVKCRGTLFSILTIPFFILHRITNDLMNQRIYVY